MGPEILGKRHQDVRSDVSVWILVESTIRTKIDERERRRVLECEDSVLLVENGVPSSLSLFAFFYLFFSSSLD